MNKKFLPGAALFIITFVLTSLASLTHVKAQTNTFYGEGAGANNSGGRNSGVGYLVLSSGYVYSFREAEVMRALAVDNGVPPSVIVLEQRAASTYQNVAFVDEILRDHHWRSILLVSSPYHMRRATMVWRKVAPEVTVIPSPPPQSQFYDHPHAGATLSQIRGILQEYVAIFAYWRRGWL